MRDLELVDARAGGRSVWALTTPRYLSNAHLALHGGGAALLLDMCTMTALAPLARDGFWVFLGGLTRSLYARPPLPARELTRRTAPSRICARSPRARA